MILSRAPVRLSMGGGGTDLPSYYKEYGGFLLATSINKYVNIVLNKRFEEDIRLSYSKTEIVDDISKIEHRIFREALNYTGITKQIELASISDVPSNCGLGTSSTFTVALLNALYAYKRNYVSIDKLAEAACHIEIDILKEPIGKQDQYASAYGGFNAYYFNKDGSVNVEPVDIKEEMMIELQNNLFLFYLNITRSASSILTDQNEKSKQKDSSTLDKLHRIKEIGIHTKKVLEQGKINEFGEILHNHWMTKKGLSSKVSDPYIDEAYDIAMKNGAIGGKVVGAGGGGFLLVYCPNNKPKLVEALRKFGLKPTWFSFEFEGAKKIYSA
ncbi:MAG: sugar kinase [Ignavibacteriota bacterium]|nr:sugar kinase [Ignavibacteriota bacterium]